eukprot:EG_transcript_4972
MAPCTVASVRAELGPALSARYKDYRIERWIAQKKGNQAEVVRAILAQRGNDDRLELILTDPKRRKATLEELSRKVLNIIHNPTTHELILYMNTRNQGPQFDEQREGDALLVTMHYLLHRIDELEGVGRQAVCVIDKTEAESPKISEVEGKTRMFSNIMFRSFPGTFANTYLCCTWGLIARKAVSTLAKGVGLQVEFVTPAELVTRLGKAYAPTTVGGDYYLDAARPMDAVVKEFLHSFGKKIVAAPEVAAACAAGCKWADITSQPFQLPPKSPAAPAATALVGDQRGLLAAGLFALVATVLGQYLAVLMVAAGAVYAALCGQVSSEPAPQPLVSVVRCILDSQYAECMALLESASASANLQEFGTYTKQEMQSLALALTASLRVHQKDRLKRCFREAAGTVAMLPQAEQELELSLAKWQRLHQFMQGLGALQVSCPCGCNGRGDLDWLDAHFDATPGSRAAVIAQLGRGPNATTSLRVPPSVPLSPAMTPPHSQFHVSRSREEMSPEVLSNGGLTPRSPAESPSPAHHERYPWMKDWRESWGHRKDEWKEEWEHRRTELSNKYRRDKDSPSANQPGRATTPLAGGLRLRLSRDDSLDAAKEKEPTPPGPGRRERVTRHFSPSRQDHR